jgi:hypothetical protein
MRVPSCIDARGLPPAVASAQPTTQFVVIKSNCTAEGACAEIRGPEGRVARNEGARSFPRDDYTVGRQEGGGTHTRPPSAIFRLSRCGVRGRQMWFAGTTVLRIESSKIAEEVRLDRGAAALQRLGILGAA